MDKENNNCSEWNFHIRANGINELEYVTAVQRSVIAHNFFIKYEKSDYDFKK